MDTNMIGIIPTRVGTSTPQKKRLTVRWDHPHACGDKSKKNEPSHRKTGSSPRVWGQAVSKIFLSKLPRIIPTRVGTSHKVIYGIVITVGSSPRVWGQAAAVSHIALTVGIIPTRVGTRLSSAVQYSVAWDHPHACGDKLITGTNPKGIEGSSPRVWGQAPPYQRRVNG